MTATQAKEIQTVRKDTLLKQLVLVDGLGGSGKSLFSAIVAAIERVEILNFSSEIENLCALKYLNKISGDAVEAMIRIQVDLAIYEIMMGRRANFRLRDVSSVFRDTDWFTYVKRIFQKGDEFVPDRIYKEKPILHFATHNLLAFSKPVFNALGNRVSFIEVVRHPLYMIIQQTQNQSNHYKRNATARQFHLFIKYKDEQLPFWNYGQEKLYLNGNPVERAIYEMWHIKKITEYSKKNELQKNSDKILTIPFEPFIFNPFPYLEKIVNLLKSNITSKTRKVMKKQKVPRKKISDGIPLAIYKRFGWEPPIDEFSEKQEMDKRRNFAISQGANKNALEMLDKMSEEYKEKYLKGIIDV